MSWLLVGRIRRILDKYVLVPAGIVAVHEFLRAPTVQGVRPGQGAEIKNGRAQVRAADYVFDPLALGQRPRSAKNQWHVGSLIVTQTLVVVVPVRRIVLTVVGCEYDNGFLAKPQFVHCLQQPTDILIVFSCLILALILNF